MKNDIFDQIKSITRKLISSNISINQNFPLKQGNDILYEGYKNLAFTLKDRPYKELYYSLIDEKDYNFLLLDGAIIQMKYQFRGNSIEKQILSYYPTPNDIKYVEAPQDFEESECGKNLFTENKEGQSVTFPIRFDYSSSMDFFVELDHPFSHATLGNFDSCRIPVSSPVTPYKFLGFILRSFYFKKFKEEFDDGSFFNCPLRFENSITMNEQKLLHFNFI